MSRSTWSKVEEFAVRLPSGESSTTVTANGNQQVEVIVDIKVVDAKGYPVQLTEFDINHLNLIDSNKSDRFVYDWSFRKSAKPNNNPVSPATAVSGAGPLSGVQSFSFWVSTVVAEPVSIGASVLMPDESLVTTITDPFSSHVSCRGTAPISYTVADVNFVYENTSNSKPFADGVTMDQDNYYLTLKNGNPIVSVEWNYGVLNMFALFNEPVRCVQQFAWPLDSTEKQTITYQSATATDSYEIKVNNRAGTVCFTRMSIKDTANPSVETFEYPVTFRIIDDQGNYGDFTASPSGDFNNIKLSDYPQS